MHPEVASLPPGIEKACTHLRSLAFTEFLKIATPFELEMLRKQWEKELQQARAHGHYKAEKRLQRFIFRLRDYETHNAKRKSNEECQKYFRSCLAHLFACEAIHESCKPGNQSDKAILHAAKRNFYVSDAPKEMKQKVRDFIQEHDLLYQTSPERVLLMEDLPSIRKQALELIAQTEMTCGIDTKN